MWSHRGRSILAGAEIRGTEDARDGDKDCRRRAHGTQARVGDDEERVGGGDGEVRGGGDCGVWFGGRIGVASGAGRPAHPAHGADGGAAGPGGRVPGGRVRRGRACVRGVRRADAPRGARRVAGGDGAGPGPGVDGAARMRRLPEDRAAAGAGVGRRGFDDADGTAHGEPGGVVVLLRGGGQAARGVGGRELRGEGASQATRRRAHDAPGGRRLVGRRRCREPCRSPRGPAAARCRHASR